MAANQQAKNTDSNVTYTYRTSDKNQTNTQNPHDTYAHNRYNTICICSVIQISISVFRFKAEVGGA